ncbi:MAG TPA: GNAT family N-acetyltransferase [Candidatus Bathyarchaeia archaeon]|nr:GNAT family N-acetyltransferase [Candidatus Bathyarchaeia archaeon]
MSAEERDKIANLSLETRIGNCRLELNARTQRGGILPMEVYRLTDGVFFPTDTDNPLIQRLITNYGAQLLIPLFQESPPYNRLNQLKDKSARYTSAVVADEVTRYLSINQPPPDRIFILLANPLSLQPFSDLIGYAIGYGLEAENGMESLIRNKFAPGVVGTDQNDRFELTKEGQELVVNLPGKCAYYDGVGVAQDWQGKSLGLLLMREFFQACQQKGCDFVATRVVREAKNWPLFAGIDDNPQTALGGTIKIATYFNPLFDPEKDYRAIFVSEVPTALTSLDKIIARKMTIELNPSQEIKTTPECLILRHGQSQANVLGLVDSYSPGQGLTETGKTQAIAAATEIKQAGYRVRQIITSPFRRTREMSEIIAEQLRVTIRRDKRLKDAAEGEWNRRPENLPERIQTIKQMRSDPTLRYGGSGESWEEIRSRLVSFISETDLDQTLVITHQLTGKLLLTLLNEWEAYPEIPFSPGQLLAARKQNE